MSDRQVRTSGSSDSLYPPDRIDRALIQQIAEKRCVKSLETLYQQYQPRVVGFLQRLTHDDDVVEDVYNDVMLRVWDKAHQYQGQSKVSSWIFSIAYRACLRTLKRQRFRHDVRETFAQWISALGTATEDSIEGTDSIAKALATLSPNHRLVVELSYFGGYSTDEVSQITGCPANTVKTRLFHARKNLRTFLQATEAQQS